MFEQTSVVKTWSGAKVAVPTATVVCTGQRIKYLKLKMLHNQVSKDWGESKMYLLPTRADVKFY